MRLSDEKAISLLRTYRRNLHRIPEIGSSLFKTQSYVKEVLSPLRCSIKEVAQTGLLAFFDMGAGATTAIRCDMDALPVTEINTCDYASVHPGCMHACGHDGHMSMVLTLAQYLEEEKELPFNILLIFQPAEETTGGAREICDTGIFEEYRINRVFGIHLWPFAKAGLLTAKPGPQMAKSSELTVEILGKSAHAATAEEGIDALYIACQYIAAAYKMQQEEVPSNQRTLLKICKMESGTARNVISGKTSLLGTMRAFDMDTFHFMRHRLLEIAEELEAAYGCKISVHVSEGYPPVVNNETLFESIAPTLSSVDFKPLADAAMISEDFSFYGLMAPSVFFFLGTGTSIPLHSNNFDFDEEVLLSGYHLYRALVSLA